MSFQVPAYRIKQCFWLLFFVALFFLAGTSFYHEYYYQFIFSWQKLLIDQVNLGNENVAASWFSSMMLLTAGLLSLAAYYSDKQRYGGKLHQIVNTGWLCTASVFFLLSFDEMGSVHETIGNTALFTILGNGEGWLFFEILVGLVGLLMVAFGWLRLRRVPLSAVLFFAGVLLYLSNPFQENYEISSFHNAADPAQWKRPLFLLLLEEGSELAGSFCFISSCIVYLKKAALLSGYQGIQVLIKTKMSAFMRLYWGLLGAGGLAIFLIESSSTYQTGAGIGQNWFSAAMAFVLFVAALYFGFRPQNNKRDKLFFSLLAIMALSFSIGAGIDFLSNDYTHRPMFQALIVAACCLMFGLLFRYWLPAWSKTVRLSLPLWLVFTAISIFLPQFFAIVFFYCGMGCLLSGLAIQYLRLNSLNR